MSDIAKKRKRLLTQMRVQRFCKRHTLNANIEKTDDTSMCNLSTHNPSNITQKIHEELYNKKLSAEEDEEFDTDCENETSNVSNFNDININSTQDRSYFYLIKP